MPKGRTRQQRAAQVLKWIDANWIVGRKISVRWVAELLDDDGEEYCGYTDRVGKDLVIVLSKKRLTTIQETTDIVIHEACHAIQWPPSGKAERRRHHHPPSFWALYGEIRDRFDHDHGHEEADAFEW